MEHTTSKTIKRQWAEKLLRGEELTSDDREQIAYELGCTSLLEQAYRHLCIKNFHGTYHDEESVRKMIVRGNKELKKSEYEYDPAIDDIASNIKARHDDFLMKAALKEHFKPTHIEG